MLRIKSLIYARLSAQTFKVKKSAMNLACDPFLALKVFLLKACWCHFAKYEKNMGVWAHFYGIFDWI